ncbi:MAG: aldehyde dehydrogenase family protein [Cyanobacteria bacterium P01_G01_bin.38]
MTSPRTLAELVGDELNRSTPATWLEVKNPATGTTIGLAPVATKERVEIALLAARNAFDTTPWRHEPQRRAELLRHVAEAIEENLEPLAHAESTDTGMTLKMCMHGHLPRAIEHFRFFAGETERLSGQVFQTGEAFVQLVEREPIGVVAVLAPWNAPLAVASMNVAAAMAAGNCVVIKSSERAPFSLSLLAEIFHGIGIPPGVVSVVHGPAEPTGSALVGSALVDGLCFVGGTETARHLIATSPQPFRRMTLELGGKSPTIICNNADLNDAVDGALLSAFSSNGEVCTAGSRILVHVSRYDDFVEQFVRRASAIRVGNPSDPGTELGPLIDENHRCAVEAHLRAAVRSGARIMCGGECPEHLKPGSYLAPAVLTDVTPQMAIWHDEVFGPVAAIVRFEQLDEAVRLANDSRYGLSASVWCGDTADGIALARHLQCGTVSVNAPVIRDIRVPFGGWKESGLGRVGGRFSIEQFTEIKVTNLCVGTFSLPRYGTSPDQ